MEFEIKGIKLRVKQVNPFEFSAFKIVYARAISDNDTVALTKAHEIMGSWVEREVEGKWLTVWDNVAKRYILDDMNQFSIVTKIVSKVTEEFVLPLFLSTVE